jgi:hypothetical protein
LQVDDNALNPSNRNSWLEFEAIFNDETFTPTNIFPNNDLLSALDPSKPMLTQTMSRDWVKLQEKFNELKADLTKATANYHRRYLALHGNGHCSCPPSSS